MTVTAIVPINALSRAKSRLRPLLGDCDRQGLVLWMADRVLTALRQSAVVDALAVVSPDDRVLCWAEQRGATPLAQRDGGLNDGLELGRRWAVERGAWALLALFGDLPLLTPEEVVALVEAARTGEERAVVLAPDGQERGTNGVVLRPALSLPFLFGAGSLERHRDAARAHGVAPVSFMSNGTAFDVDLPADVETLVRRGLWRPWDGPLAVVRREEGA